MPSPSGCPHCGAAFDPAQRFCGECGKSLARTCGACGAENPPAHRFCGACGRPLTEAAPAAAPADERRWVSVLFADLTGFTRRSEQMDHEEVKDLAVQLTDRMARVVEEHGGTVANVMGDGVMALFGAPVAHEDDAERAVRAAVAMEREVAAMAGGLHLHIGVNTGPVMAGAAGPDRRYTAMGDTVNTAARVMAAAAGGEVLVGRETYQATRDTVSYAEHEPLQAKGKEAPVEVWTVVAVADVARERPLGSTTFVGREAELRLLEDVWRRALRDRQPHLVTLVGEAGVGKSRLLAEFERRLGESARFVRGRCLPYGRGLGYWGLARALRQLAGSGLEDGAESVRGRLRESVSSLLGGEADADAVLHHLDLLCGVEEEGSGQATLTDQRVLFASLRRYLEAHARRRPLFIAIEDIHWAEAPLLDALEFVAGRAADAPLVILTTARNELHASRPGWGGGIRAFTSLPLDALDPDSFRALCDQLCSGLHLPPQAAANLRRSADGNPLFAEQLAAMVAERGESLIPATIKALVGARLDTLDAPGRATLQLGAVLGLSFSDAGLEALGATVADAEALVFKGFLREVPEALGRRSVAYGFRHALFRDVAYETLPRAERRRLHAVAADWLEAAAGERVEEYLGHLADHAVEADQGERALAYLERAAARASRVAAHRQAAELLAKAIELAEGLGREDLATDLHLRRGVAFCRVGAWPEAVPPLERALERFAADRVEDRVIAEAELAIANNWLARGDQLREHAERSVALAETTGRADLQAIAAGALAVHHSSDGHVDEVIRSAERAAEQARYVHHPLLASAMDVGSLGLYWRGRSDAALAAAREAFEVSVAVGDSQNAVRALSHQSLALAAAGRFGEALAAAERADRVAHEQGVESMRARAVTMWGGILLQLGQYQAAAAKAAEGMELAATSAFAPAAASCRIDLVFNHVRQGDVGAAERTVDEVAEAIEQAQGTHGWLWRLRFDQARAEIALAREQPEEVLRWAASADERNRLPGRAKYSALAAHIRARGLVALGRHAEATAEARRAVEIARSLESPGLLLDVAPLLAALAEDEGLAAEVERTRQAIASSLPADLRHLYLDTEVATA